MTGGRPLTLKRMRRVKILTEILCGRTQGVFIQPSRTFQILHGQVEGGRQAGTVQEAAAHWTQTRSLRWRLAWRLSSLSSQSLCLFWGEGCCFAKDGVLHQDPVLDPLIGLEDVTFSKSSTSSSVHTKLSDIFFAILFTVGLLRALGVNR